MLFIFLSGFFSLFHSPFFICPFVHLPLPYLSLPHLPFPPFLSALSFNSPFHICPFRPRPSLLSYQFLPSFPLLPSFTFHILSFPGDTQNKLTHERSSQQAIAVEWETHCKHKDPCEFLGCLQLRCWVRAIIRSGLIQTALSLQGQVLAICMQRALPSRVLHFGLRHSTRHSLFPKSPQPQEKPTDKSWSRSIPSNNRLRTTFFDLEELHPSSLSQCNANPTRHFQSLENTRKI